MKLNQKIEHLLCLIKDGQYHHGSSLAKTLGVSRTAIWKYIKQLESLDLSINHNRVKGYQLTSPLVLLDKDKILANLNLPAEYFDIDILSLIDSTNDYLKKKANLAKKIQVCLAEYQSLGKGRMGRSWFSPFATNLTLSYKINLARDIASLSGFSLVIGLAIKEALTPWLINGSIGVKWPNDVFVNNKKIAGILVEVQAESHDFSEVVIGIGVNINMHHAELSNDWTSIFLETNQLSDRNQIAASLIETIHNYNQRFFAKGFVDFMGEWELFDILCGKACQLKQHHSIIKGIATGVSVTGCLKILEENGYEREFSSGDAFLCKK